MKKLFILALLAGCSAQPAPASKPADTFVAKRYDLPDGAYLQAVSMPGYNHCMIYTNEKLGKIQMVCDIGTPVLAGPEVESR